MCELLGLSGSAPFSVTFSLDEFARHGGKTGPHRDGWGIAFYEGRDVRLIKEAKPAADSETVAFVKGQNFNSPLVLSHIRRATVGNLSLANTQPFTRNWAGAFTFSPTMGIWRESSRHARYPASVSRRLATPIPNMRFAF